MIISKATLLLALVDFMYLDEIWVEVWAATNEANLDVTSAKDHDAP